MKNERDSTAKEKDNIWKELHKERERISDMQAEASKKEIEILDMKNEIENRKEALSTEEANVMIANKNKNKMQALYENTRQQMIKLQEEGNQKDFVIKQQELEVDNLKKITTRTPERK